ncbi:MAG: sigma-70 family RNA polymerase sigma factor, partial [Alistipes sp.]|nr:sigma-70 family RNA polymerase sigma factor [Alistipes sp.]
MNAQVQSDRALLGQYLAGDQRAISQLIERHSRRVRDYIRMIVKDRDVAEDIFQETFIKAVRVIDEGRYVDSGKFLSWVLRIAHNQVIDHFRHQKQQKTITEADSGYDVLGTLRFAEPTAEDQLMNLQTAESLRLLIEELPD